MRKQAEASVGGLEASLSLSPPPAPPACRGGFSKFPNIKPFLYNYASLTYMSFGCCMGRRHKNQFLQPNKTAFQGPQVIRHCLLGMACSPSNHVPWRRCWPVSPASAGRMQVPRWNGMSTRPQRAPCSGELPRNTRIPRIPATRGGKRAHPSRSVASPHFCWLLSNFARGGETMPPTSESFSEVCQGPSLCSSPPTHPVALWEHLFSLSKPSEARSPAEARGCPSAENPPWAAQPPAWLALGAAAPLPLLPSGAPPSSLSPQGRVDDRKE